MEAVLQQLRRVAVPPFSQLKQGAGVNIVLKADQPTGRLTTGHISQILGRGYHPRGIKVRVVDGQVGRVQSLTSAFLSDIAPSIPVEVGEFERQFGGPSKRSHRGRGYRMQSDYRRDETAPEERSLEDYIVVKSKKKNSKREHNSEAADTPPQAQLEKEFPKVDAALIAAILSEHSDVQDARDVLGAIA